MGPTIHLYSESKKIIHENDLLALKSRLNEFCTFFIEIGYYRGNSCGGKMKITNNKDKEKEFLKQIRSMKKFDIIIEGIIKKDFSAHREDAINVLFKMAMEGLLPEDISNLVKDIKKTDQNREKIEKTSNLLQEKLYQLLNQKYKLDFNFIDLLQDIQKELEVKKEQSLETVLPPNPSKRKKASKKGIPDFDMREIIVNPKEAIS